MLIDDIDFAASTNSNSLWRGEKKPSAHWDARAEHIAIVDAPVIDSYLRQLLAKIDLPGASSLFDMGCGPGTVALALAGQLNEICGVDYSQGMPMSPLVGLRRKAFAMRSGASGRGKRAGGAAALRYRRGLPFHPGGGYARCDAKARSSGATAGLHHSSG
jgi:SAM-dependent methyltransferase